MVSTERDPVSKQQQEIHSENEQPLRSSLESTTGRKVQGLGEGRRKWQQPRAGSWGPDLQLRPQHVDVHLWMRQLQKHKGSLILPRLLASLDCSSLFCLVLGGLSCLRWFDFTSELQGATEYLSDHLHFFPVCLTLGKETETTVQIWKVVS